MTELEYKKACRGGVSAIYQEYAWGNTSIFQSSTYSISNGGSSNSSISNMGTNTGNAQIGSNAKSRPFRCGIFAKSATNKTREETGATIYGVMEMTGNLYETVITVGNSDGQSFQNTGDGSLTSDSYANVTNWPGASIINYAVIVTKPNGIIYKGGAFNTASTNLNYGYVSARNAGPNHGFGGRGPAYGIRLARNAP